MLRTVKPRNPESYMAACEAGRTSGEERDPDARELPFEFMLNALRLTDGFEVSLFSERTGLPITAVHAALERAEARGLITRDHARIAPTERGRLFLNDLLEIFL